MGYASRQRVAEATTLRARLAGFKVAVDVQHVYRPSHVGDEGSVYTDAAGMHVTEAHLSAIYAIALCNWFRDRSAEVLTNDRSAGVLVGEYWTRNRAAAEWGACAYLACHVNAGGGRYAAIEYMNGTPGGLLALSILPQLPVAAPEIVGLRSLPLIRGQRGAVCIEAFPSDRGAAVLVEPFFGDAASQRALLGADRLAGIAGAIGEGVARWWESWRRVPPA